MKLESRTEVRQRKRKGEKKYLDNLEHQETNPDYKQNKLPLPAEVEAEYFLKEFKKAFNFMIIISLKVTYNILSEE